MRIVLLAALLATLAVTGCNSTGSSANSGVTTNGVTHSTSLLGAGQTGNTYNGVALNTTGSTVPPPGSIAWRTAVNGTLINNNNTPFNNGASLPAKWTSTTGNAISKAQGDTLNGVSQAQATAAKSGVNINPLTNLLPQGWGGTTSLTPATK